MSKLNEIRNHLELIRNKHQNQSMHRDVYNYVDHVGHLLTVIDELQELIDGCGEFCFDWQQAELKGERDE